MALVDELLDIGMADPRKVAARFNVSQFTAYTYQNIILALLLEHVPLSKDDLDRVTLRRVKRAGGDDVDG